MDWSKAHDQYISQLIIRERKSRNKNFGKKISLREKISDGSSYWLWHMNKPVGEQDCD